MALAGALLLAVLLALSSTASSQNPPDVTVSFGESTYTVAEADDPETTAVEEHKVTVTLTLSADPERTVVIPLTAANQGGASAADYSGVPASLSFASGETSKSFTFTATGDAVDDDGESVKLGFGTLPTGVSAGSTSESTVSITDIGPVIAVSSSPGEDGSYTTLDVITLSATFSEAVTVSGEPELSLDIGGTKRIAEYAEPGPNTGQLLFRYTVQPVDQDDDGISVEQAALSLNGGTIQTTSGSTDASLANRATSFSDHKVDTELVLIGNMEQTDGTPLRINAGETYQLAFQYGAGVRLYEASNILLDVKTASDTLTLTATVVAIRGSGALQETRLVTLSGSVAATGPQPFQADAFFTEALLFADLTTVELLLTATGSGYIEIGTTSSTDEDEAKAYDWSIGDSFSKSTDGTNFTEQTGHLPRFSVIGHANEVTLRVLAAQIVSAPADGVAYTAGEDIEVFIYTNTTPSAATDSLTIPLQLGPNQRQAKLVTIRSHFRGGFVSTSNDPNPGHFLHFAYTVQPDDTAAGVGIAADPLGSAGIVHTMDHRFARDLSFPAQPPASGSRVAGTSTEMCDAVHCAHVIDRYPELSFKHDRYALEPGGEVMLTLVLDKAHTEAFVVPLDYKVQGSLDIGPDQLSFPSSITFNVGETEKSFTVGVSNDVAVSAQSAFALVTGFLPFLRSLSSRYGVDVYLTDTPESVSTSLNAEISRGYLRPTKIESLSRDILSNSVFQYDQQYIIDGIIVHSFGFGGDAESYLELRTTQPLSKEVIARLGFVMDDKTLPFSEAHVSELNHRGSRLEIELTRIEEGIEAAAGYYFVEPGLRWERDQKYSFKIVELPVTATFDASTYEADEGDSVEVTVMLGGGFRGKTVTLPISVANNDGATDADYSGVPENLVFAAGETEKTFTVTVTDDTVDDDDESITLTFGSSDLIKSGGTNETATIDLKDNDDPEVTVSFGASTYTVAESDDPNTTPAEEHKVTVTVTLSADPERTVVIPITTTNQGGASSADYSGVPASVSFDSGETSKTFTFTATPDTVDDDDESVKLAFGTLPARVSAGTTAATTISITDDDDPEVTVSFGASTYTVAESDDPNTTPAEEHKVTVTVTLNADPERSVVIPITKTNQGGASGADYSGVPASVSFASGETSKSFTFTATPDTVDDDDESVKLAFGALPARVSAGTTAETTISITDDDDPEVTVTFAASAYYVAESDDAETTNLEENKVTVTLTLSADPERSVTIPITKTNQGGASDADYSGVPAGVTFASGETSKSFTFTAAEDTVDDKGESVKLSFGTLPSRVTAGFRAETTIFITDECAQDDIWCAEVEFGRLYETELERDAVDRGSFESNNVVYRVSTIWVRDVYDPDDIQPPFRIPERTKLIFTLEVAGGDCVPISVPPSIGQPPCNWVTLPNEDTLDWTLHVTTVKDGETLAAALPFSEARGGGTSPRWNWYGRDIENLRLAWSDGQAYRFRIVRDLRSGRTAQAPGPPLYLRVKPVPYDGLWLYWVVPQQRDDSSPQDVTYKVQWKLSTGSWETPADVSEQTRGASVNFGIVEVIEDEVLAGLTAGSEYHFRVIATNAAGDGPPSNVITHTTPAAQQYPGNDPPTGAPAITGTAQVGETLSATTATIEDADGLDGATFAYEWLRSGVAIEGATGQSYTVVEADVGSRLYVRVTFTDDGGNEESLTSEPTDTVVFPPLRLESATVDGADLKLTYSHPLNATSELLETAFTVTVGGTAVTVSEASASGSVVTLVLASAVAAGDTVTVGYEKPETDNRNHVVLDAMGRPAQNFSGRAVTNDTASAGLTASVRNVPASHDGSASFTFELHFSEAPTLSYVALREHAFTVTGGSVVNARRLTPGSNLGWEITVAPSGSGAVTLTLAATTDCEDEGAICTGDGKQLSSALRVSVPGPASRQALQQSAQENSPATGAPAIGGTAQVGETLTASTTGIADADGLTNATFSYGWLADGVAIAGATGSSYTLTAAEEGKAITVRVTFTDDAGNAESLTSAATSAVAPAPLTASVREAPESHDGSAAFTFELHFSEEFGLSYVALRDHAFTVTGGSIEQARRLTQASNQGWEITVRPSGSGAVTLTLPVTTDCEDEGAVCTGDGKMLSERLETVIPGP